MKRLFLTLIVLSLSACSNLGAPPTLEPTRAVPTLATFKNYSNVYRWDSPALRAAFKNGRIGGSSERAAVPLLFGADGRLRKQSQLGGLRHFKKNAGSTAKAVAYLRSIGVHHVFYTDYTTYKRVMLRHSGVLSTYSTLSTKSVQKMTVLNQTRRLYNPYARLSTRATREVGALGTCSPAPGILSTGASLPQDTTLTPQQDGECVALCIAQELLMFSGCVAIPFPFNLVCAIAAGTISTICVDNCF